jgi:DNA topoisomerase IA
MSRPSPRPAAKAETLYLATDPDREGEAISWHLHEILRQRDLLSDKPVQRVVFHEITERAILDAMTHPRSSCRWTWSTPSRPAARWTIWSASTCRRCCGRKSGPACRPGGCSRRRCG